MDLQNKGCGKNENLHKSYDIHSMKHAFLNHHFYWSFQNKNFR